MTREVEGRMTIPTIAFDEAGNTGQNLLDPAQPIFVLSSVCLEISEAQALCDLVGSPGEVHFKHLKRSHDGQRRILALLRSSLLTRDTVKVTVIHKSFMVTAKVIDLLVEEMAYQDGVDLLKRGANVAMSNILYFVTPTVCGVENFRAFQDAFVRMIRTRIPAEVTAFYDSVNCLYQACKIEDHRALLAMIAGTRGIIHDVLEDVRITALDPAVPAFVSLCYDWENQLDRPFCILHDASKPIAFDKTLLEHFMDTAVGDEEVISVVGSKIKLPLRATGITFVDSLSAPQVQVADVVASSFAFLHNHGTGDPSFRAELEAVPLREWLTGCVWPMPTVDPKVLGTEENPGVLVLERMSQFLEKRIDMDNGS